jgi:hypothetical protein
LECGSTIAAPFEAQAIVGVAPVFYFSRRAEKIGLNADIYAAADGSSWCSYDRSQANPTPSKILIVSSVLAIPPNLPIDVLPVRSADIVSFE